MAGTGLAHSHTHFPNCVFVRRARSDAPSLGPAPSCPSPWPPLAPGYHTDHWNHCTGLLPLLKPLPVSLRIKASVTKKALPGPAALVHSALPLHLLHCSSERASHHPGSELLHWLFPLLGILFWNATNGLLFQVSPPKSPPRSVLPWLPSLKHLYSWSLSLPYL